VCGGYGSLLMTGQDERRDLAALVVPQTGWLGAGGGSVGAVPVARIRPGSWLVRLRRSCGICRRRAGRRPRCARMRSRCCAGTGSCGRPGCRGIRRPGPRPGTSAAGSRSPSSPAAPAIQAMRARRVVRPRAVVRTGVPNPVTGKAPPGRGYAPATVSHSESVLRGFYDFHCEAGAGPVVNPFPLARGRRGRAHAHHNPMEPYRGERSGRYRPRLARRAPHHIRRRSSTSCSPPWARTATGAGRVLGVHRGARIRAARRVVPGRRPGGSS